VLLAAPAAAQDPLDDEDWDALLAEAAAGEDGAETGSGGAAEAVDLDELRVDYEVDGQGEVAQVESIDRQELEESGAETVAELLEERGNMQVFSAVRGEGLRLRGLEPEHVLFLVDGERIIGRMDGTLDLSRFQLEDYASVEILRGASSALYGSDAIGGVVDLIPRDPPEGWATSLRATYGYQDRLRTNPRGGFEGGPRTGDVPRDGYGGTYDLSASAGYGGSHGGAEVHGGFHRLDAFDLDPSDAATTAPQSSTWDIGGSGVIRFDRGRLRIHGTYLRRDDVALELRGRTVVERANRTEQARVGASTRITLRRGTLRIWGSYGAFRDQFVRRVRGGAQMGEVTDTREQIGQLRLRYVHAFSSHHVTTVGYDTSLERLASPRLSGPGTRARLAPYVQHEWQPSERVGVVPGLRFDADSAFGQALSPKLQLRFDVHDRVRIRASGGRGFRAPGFRELLLQFTQNAALGYIVNGNPDLRPEQSWGLDGGVELDLARTEGRRLALHLTGHWTRVRDLITTDLQATEDGVSTYHYVNVGDARTAGLESQLRYATRGSWGRLDVDGSYTWLHARDLQSGDPLPGRARHQASLRVRYARSGWSARWRSQLMGARIFNGDDGPLEAEPYLALDLRLAKTIADERLEVFVGVDNVLNNGGVYLTTRPRTFWVGLAARRRPEP